MKLVYICGPFRGLLQWETMTGLEGQVELLGAVATCPHGAECIEIVKWCGAVLMMPAWRSPTGAQQCEQEFVGHGIQVFHTLDELAAWLNR
ncbi:MAG: hypothetical protein ABSA52_19120 [Candidatus Binatia bacterium]|jgi:hypothetical protein